MRRLQYTICLFVSICLFPFSFLTSGTAETVDINTYFAWPVSLKWVFELDMAAKGKDHSGIDAQVKQPNKDPVAVNAVAAGEVIRVENGCSHVSAGASHDCIGGSYGRFGNYVAIKHPDINGKTYISIYMHLKQNTIVVAVGDVVKKGQKLAIGGSSGGSTGYHLHFSIHQGSFPGDKTIRSKTFQYYQQNPAVLKGMIFTKDVSTNSKYFGTWIEKNCVEKNGKWSYAGSGEATNPTPAKAVNSADGLHQYVRYDSSLKWINAETFCESKGGHLTTITNATEQKDVVSVLNGCTQNVYFIGGSDAEKEGAWKWVTNEAFTYKNWDQDYTEPSNKSGENYAAIMGKNVGKNKQTGDWIDIYNDGDAAHDGYALFECGFVCEYDYVMFDANGGTDAPVKQLKRLNTDLVLPANGPKRSGYTFQGWAASQTATAAQYQPGGTYKGNTGTVLYAVWKKNVFNSVLELPEDVTEIGPQAFYGTDAEAIIVPRGTELIADDAFPKDMVLIGERGTPIENYANKKGMTFVELKDYYVSVNETANE